jgi:hypothetical protein
VRTNRHEALSSFQKPSKLSRLKILISSFRESNLGKDFFESFRYVLVYRRKRTPPESEPSKTTAEEPSMITN